MKNRVLILVENLSVPFDQRVRRETAALTEAGYKVSVICPRGEKFDTKRHEVIDGVSIYRYKAFEAKSGLLAYMYEFSQAIIKMMLISIWVFFRQGFDVIQICNPPDLLFLVVLPYKILGKKVIFDHHDLAPETYLSKKGDEKGDLISRTLLVFEKLTFKTADLVLATNESYKEVAISRGKVESGNVIVVRNGPDPKRIRIVPENPRLRRGKKSLIFYIGTMGPQDGVDYLLRSIRYLVHDRERTDFHFFVVRED